MGRLQRIIFLSVLLICSAVHAESHRFELYYLPSCSHCREITDQFLPQMQAKYPGLFELEIVDISIPENNARLAQMEQAYGFRYQPPTLVMEGIVLAGEEAIKAQFEATLRNLTEQRMENGEWKMELPPHPVPLPQGERVILKEKFSAFSFLAIVTAGFLDGINPCAFTTIVFFISFLGFAGYQRCQIQWIGIFFILSVFLTYLAIGLGLLRVLHTLSIFPILSKGLLWLTAAVTALFCFLSFKDFWIYRKTGQTREWTLQLPLSIKQRIHRVIGEGYRGVGAGFKPAPTIPLFKLIGTALITGFLVSSLESVCTGQLYVPTLVYMTRLKETAWQAWGYLLLYNGAFILPLAAVFLFSLFGFTSQQFGQWASKHLGIVKLGTALFFLILTIILIKTGGV
ncbi:MAG: hypothetical protein HYS56_06070 [Candidatus Omnitrophica bacterium]|nr:hypothetical protein [Candidatus Omnitrophota bacterium]